MAAGYCTTYTGGNPTSAHGYEHAKDPDMQHKLSSLNTPKIFFFKDIKVPNPNVKH